MKNLKINKKFTVLALAGVLVLVGRTNMIKRDSIKDFNISDLKVIETVYADTEEETKEIITTDYLNIRKESNTDSKILDTVTPGTRLEGISNDGEWYKIVYHDEIAYVKSEYVYEAVNNDKELLNVDELEIEKTKCVEATTEVNVRKESNTDSKVLTTLNKGEILETTQLLDNGWYEVLYNGEKAYIKSDYVKEITKEKVNTPFNKIVMFTQDSDVYSILDNSVIDNVPTYEVAYVYGKKDNKYLASVNNNICYVNKEDVKDVDNKIVIVDISDQHATLYNGNEVIVDTPVVTGKDSTPSDIGYFDIDWKCRDTYLKGPGYSSYVEYWMPYNDGEGLHDAEYHTKYDKNGNYVKDHGWRSYDEFGTNIYHSNGSHGCINLPNQAAKTIYNNVEAGNKVLVKK